MAIQVIVANKSHAHFADDICSMILEASKIRGTGIAKREPGYIATKIIDGKAIIALDQGKLIGFCYIENWEGKKYVANSGLITDPRYRGTGLGKKIKKAALILSKKLYPDSILFGITTNMAVMKINSDLGYKPVTFDKLTQDDKFWAGCKGCKNYDVLQRTKRSMCYCTAMVCDLKTVKETPQEQSEIDKQTARKRFKTFMVERRKRIKNKIKTFPILKKILKSE